MEAEAAESSGRRPARKEHPQRPRGTRRTGGTRQTGDALRHPTTGILAQQALIYREDKALKGMSIT